MNRKKLILFILLIIFALSVVWSFFAFPRQKTVKTLKYAPKQAQVAISEDSAKPVAVKSGSAADRVLRLDLLDQEQQAFKGYRRNIFKPVFVDEIKLMKQKAVASKPVVVPLAQNQKKMPTVVTTPVAASPETPRSALARFTFLGFLKKDNRKTIFLSKDKDILLVRDGERFANVYEVSSLTDQALTILAIETGEEIVVPLIENKPLTAAVK